jgi:hypothetical protein
LIFAFPRNTDFLKLRDVKKIIWPPNLQQVTISGQLCEQPDYGHYLLRDWPPSLQHVIFDHFRGFRFLYGPSGVFEGMPFGLDSIHITDRSHHLYHQNVVVELSNVRCLSLPANLAHSKRGPYPKHTVLERLEVRWKSEEGRYPFFVSDLLYHAERISSLQHIRLHNSLLEDDAMSFELLDALLRSRAPVNTSEDGMQSVKSREGGIIVFED